ncbi:MAG: DUF455 family protein [Chitinophagaceae bacterium]|nr:DUF455 family protein [Oligoflexus sp.]
MQLRSFAEQLLLGQNLSDKLSFPANIVDDAPGLPYENGPEVPGRPSFLQFASGEKKASFPAPKDLHTPRMRGVVLHFFANHELLAIELMALVLLRFPDADSAFRQGILATIREEQEHLGLYLKRMKELGTELGDVNVNRFFWDCLKDMKNPLDFVTGMSLTFEQANLDFASHYKKIFAELGDHETAAILQKVYDDEIGHVKHGVSWLERWRPRELSQWEAYEGNLKLPLSPARAKGPIFDRDARRRADLTEEYVDSLYIHAGTKGRVPSLYWYNADCELELAREAPGYQPQKGTQKVMGELMSSLLYVAKPGDVVVTHKAPSAAYLKQLRDLGFDLPEFHVMPEEQRTLPKELKDRRWESLQPWGWTPRTLDIFKAMNARTAMPVEVSQEGFWQSSWMELFRKSALPKLRANLREEFPELGPEIWGPVEADGALVHDLTDVLMTIDNIHKQYKIPAVIKSPYGFAGSGMLRAYPDQHLTDAQLGWIERQLDLYGCILIEPWMKRIVDISVVWSPESEKMENFVFYTNAKGQYKGHCLQSMSYALLPEHRAFLHDSRRFQKSGTEALQDVARSIRNRLAQHGYKYAAGIDTMLYEFQGQLYLKILGEVNCRMTMGHVAANLRRHINPTQSSVWQSVTIIEAQRQGWPTLQGMATDLSKRFPPKLKYGVIDEGIFFTSDPSQAQFLVSLVAVGYQAIEACEGLGALEKYETERSL